MSDTLLEVKGLKKYFKVKDKGLLHAVDGVDFDINKGETLGLVGESGCGKSTVGNTIMGLLPATGGKVLFQGKDILQLDASQSRAVKRKMQIIFQDPYSSLNPRKTVRQILAEPFLVQKIAKGDLLKAKIMELSEMTGIAKDMWSKFPHELDGGKRQTVGIARALALNPDFIICDEPVSALDVSIQAQIINLLMDLQEKLNLTYLFISHDLSVVRHISKRIAVMYLGKIVELADTEELFSNPLHPYTKALLSAIPVPKVGDKKERIILKGDVPSPLNPKPVCRFQPRCWQAQDGCSQTEPELELKGDNHWVACHLV